ncbi:CAAX prenyl protease 2 [Armadillidium nasatum]|uniref:CAAX prenyl protease 2 n=1 Tax=Armadillidium nasatum TaxID=96803 RepID=A0A5N5STH2_9CRUS|nr:CAAX prenyl protease 2 [Armadillidium nasatum]
MRKLYKHFYSMASSSCGNEIFACILLSFLYVGSLYIWTGSRGRDHPSTIKKRCASVFFMTIISPFFVVYFLNEETREKATLPQLLGIRYDGVILSAILPLLLTVILFLGPIIQNHQNIPLNSTLLIYLQPRYWYNSSQNPIWWRNQVVAPFSEEFTFRACMLPLLLQCLSPMSAIFVAPLFFGIAHLHHAIDRVKLGLPFTTVVIVSFFQFVYTSLFGFYSAFLFLRTGQFLPLFIVHAFCNHMGLPEIRELFNKPEKQRNKLVAFHALGLIAWYLLLFPLTEPSWYSNELYSL